MKCMHCLKKFAVPDVYRIRTYVPYILNCNHSICDFCITTVLKTSNAITCGTCKKVSDLSTAVAEGLRSTKNYSDVFPVNKTLLGCILYEHIMAFDERHKQKPPTHRRTYPAGITYPAVNNVQIHEIKRDVENLRKSLSKCNRHPNKPLALFCTDCSIALCVNCVSICGTHTIIELKTKNEECEEEIAKLKQSTKDILQRIKKTTAELNNKCNRPRLPSFSEKIISNPITDHFNSLYARLHITENRLTKEYDKGLVTYSKILKQLGDISKQLDTLINFSESDISAEEKEQIDYYSFLKLLKETDDFPWYLADHFITGNLESSVDVEISPEVFNTIENHCKVITKKSDLELLPTSKLPQDVAGPSIVSTSDVKPVPVLPTTTSRRVFSPQNDKAAKPLIVGSVERVTVTHINTPHDFYVQLTSIQPKLKEMSQIFNKHKKEDKLEIPEKSLIIPGKLFLAYNVQDKQWDRVKILSEEPPTNDSDSTYLVLFIDYGHTGRLSLKELQVLPDSETLPMAINCKLVNCKPISKEWTVDDSLAMLRLVSGSKQCLINVVKINGNQLDVILVTCNNSLSESNIYIADALIILGHAVAEHPVYPNTKLSVMLPTQQCGFNRQNISKNDSVVVCHVQSFSKFWVRKVQLIEFFADMMQQLKDTYSIESPIGSLYTYKIGLCVAVHDTDNGWCRGLVQKLPHDGQLQVFLADFGVTKTVHWTAVRKLLTDFLKIDQLVAFCQLANLTQFGDKWKETATNYLTKCMTSSTPLNVKGAKVLRKDKKNHHPKMELLLHIKSDDDSSQSIDTEIVEMGISSSQSTEELIPKFQIMKKPEDKQEDENISGILKLEVNILSAATPSDIYMVIKSQQGVLDNLSKELENLLKDSHPDKEAIWNVDDVCAAFLNNTKTWHRAIIKEVVTDKATVKVFTKDSALIEDVSVENLRPLDKKFTGIKDGALKCHLSGIMPGAGTKWPNYTKEYCQDLLSQYDRFYITKTGPIVNKSIPVELWVYHVTPGDALSPTIKYWLCINTKILEQGLAIRDMVDNDKSPLKQTSFEFKKESQPTDQNLDKGIISIPESVEPLIPKELYPNTSLQTIPPIFDAWIPAEPLPSSEFMGMPTFLTSDFIIYLHDIVHSEDTLQLLFSSLTHHFKDSRPMPFDMFWHPGQLCISKWEVDSKYYRGRIVKILTNNTVEVEFVDYGNTELCPISYLRKNIVMHHIPIQATKCRLTGLTPVGGEWTENILDFIHQQIVEQQCLITVLGEAVDGILPIKLKIKGIHDISQILVSLGYATYDTIPTPHTGFIKKNDVFVNDSIPSIVENVLENPISDIVDWNEMNMREEMDSLAREDDDAILQQFVTYPIIEFPTDCDFFGCEVINFTPDCELILKLVMSEQQFTPIKDKMAEIDEQMQLLGNKQPLEKCILEGKPCIAQFTVDNLWYRAKILQCNPEERKIKVNYVDFGNSEIIDADKVREIKYEWLETPVQTISCRLNSVSVSDGTDFDDLKQNFGEIFTSPLFVRIIDFDEDDNLFIVDFIKDLSEPKLAYQNLIDEGFLISDE